jgi:hypothetical protein
VSLKTCPTRSIRRRWPGSSPRPIPIGRQPQFRVTTTQWRRCRHDRGISNKRPHAGSRPSGKTFNAAPVAPRANPRTEQRRRPIEQLQRDRRGRGPGAALLPSVSPGQLRPFRAASRARSTSAISWGRRRQGPPCRPISSARRFQSLVRSQDVAAVVERPGSPLRRMSGYALPVSHAFPGNPTRDASHAIRTTDAPSASHRTGLTDARTAFATSPLTLLFRPIAPDETRSADAPPSAASSANTIARAASERRPSPYPPAEPTLHGWRHARQSASGAPDAHAPTRWITMLQGRSRRRHPQPEGRPGLPQMPRHAAAPVPVEVDRPVRRSCFSDVVRRLRPSSPELAAQLSIAYR